MDFLGLIFYFLVIIPSSIMHEYAHGWVADQLGDPTARYAGRLTADPRAHIDTFGTIVLPLLLFIGTAGRFLFAFAKPVPYNPYNLRDQKWGPVLVAIAGPLANLLMAAAFAFLMRAMPGAAITPFFGIIVYANVLLMVFNLVPIPPLDGSKLLYAVLPDSMYAFKQNLERYGFLLILPLSFFFFSLLTPVIGKIYMLLVGSAFGV